MLFDDLNLSPPIINAINEQDYKKPTPIQEKAIPAILKGNDILGCAQTGSGKTAAFSLPILEKILMKGDNLSESNDLQALILAPTRELAIQIGDSFLNYGEKLEIRTGVIFGGITPKRHIKVMKKYPHILVATPGRLLDLYDKGYVDFKKINTFVLDEADRMLDLGIIKDVKKIISLLPKQRQNLLFSATMPNQVTKLTKSILKNPVKIKVQDAPVKEIKQLVYFIERPDKTALLLKLLKDPTMKSVMVFTKTKKKADKVAKSINISNIRAKALHGDINQSQRQKALEGFKNKEIRVLVATDVAARGIDIHNLTHVVNIDMPSVAETYVHRIGRTGRAGMEGIAISFCSEDERSLLQNIEKLQNKSIEIEEIPE